MTKKLIVSKGPPLRRNQKRVGTTIRNLFHRLRHRTNFTGRNNRNINLPIGTKINKEVNRYFLNLLPSLRRYPARTNIVSRNQSTLTVTKSNFYRRRCAVKNRRKLRNFSRTVTVSHLNGNVTARGTLRTRAKDINTRMNHRNFGINVSRGETIRI